MSTTPVGRVLVVDDEADLAHLVQGYLVKAGFEVTVRHIGTEALEAVRAQDPQVVVLQATSRELRRAVACFAEPDYIRSAHIQQSISVK